MMNRSELLGNIKEDIDLLTYNMKYDAEGHIDPPENGKIAEDLRIIYNLLTPNKPILISLKFESIKCPLYKCPNCNMHIVHFKFTDKHCPNCGQALDWSKDNE